MCVITYTAIDRGDLRAGVNAGDVVLLVLPLGLEKWTPFNVRKSDEIKSIDGTAFVNYYRTDRGAYVTTNWIDDEVLQDQLYLEFASSVAGGEVFQIDPYGTFEAPVTSYDVKLQKGSSISPSRYQHWPRFKYSFTVDIV